MRIKRRLPLLIILLLCSLIMSCDNSVQKPPQSGSPAPASISFRITWPDYSGRGEAIQKIVRLYNQKSSTAVPITVVSGDEDLAAAERILQSKESGTILMLPYRYVQYFGDRGYLVDLSASFNQDAALFYPALWKLGQVRGRSYGIPWLGHSMALLYNKNLLQKAGVDVASIRDLDSLVRAMEQVEARTDVKGIGLVGANHNDVSWMVNQFITGYGSSLVTADGTTVALNNEKAKAALSFYKNVLGKHAQPSWVNDSGIEVMTHFRKEEVAFEIQGPWGVTDIQKNGSLFEVGIIALPDIGLPAEVGPMMVAVPANVSTNTQQEAINFIRFLISKEGQERIMDGEYSPEHDAYYPFRIPVRQDLSDTFLLKYYPEYRPFLLGFQRPSLDVPVPRWQVVKDKYYAPGLHQVMTGQLSIDDFLNMVETEGNKVLQEK